MDIIQEQMEVRENVSSLIDTISDMENQKDAIESIEYAIMMLENLKKELQ